MMLFPIGPVLLFLGQHVLSTEAAAPYCLPGDGCFPADESLAEFNSTVGGRLIKAQPYGAACYKDTYNLEECRKLIANKGVYAWRVSEPAAVQYTNWEQTEDLSGCVIPDPNDDGSDPSPVDGDCTLGGMSSYVVNATNADDVAAAVKFSAEHNLRLRVKNTGHDYSGRSSGAGSLSILTHYLNDAEFLEDFVPSNTDISPQDVISAGPGVDVEGLYAAGGKYGVVTIGGYTPSVGATGGYIIGGGMGPLGAYFGLGVDNVLQYEVVMADGSQQVANENTNPDLFWALRGGGGAFAIVTRVYIKTYPAFDAVNAVAGEVVCQNESSYSKLISNMIDLQVAVRDKGQNGIWQTFPSTFNLALLSIEGFTEGPIKTANETMEAFNSILTVPGCKPSVKASQFEGSSSWNDAYKAMVVPIISAGTAAGVNLADTSRIVSYDMIHDAARREEIKEHILTSKVPVIWQNSVGEASRQVAPDATSVHPAWRNAFAFVNEPVTGKWQGVDEDMMSLYSTTMERLNAMFGTVAYYNEQYTVEDNWQDIFFGDNYQRLKEIKSKLDPNGVFSCRMCVGSEAGI